MTTYREAASISFNTLMEHYDDTSIFDGNFWFAGNTLHTCLDYLIYAQITDSKQFLVKAHDLYKRLAIENTGWWVDDYAWWGNAFILALNNRSRLGYDDPLYNGLFNEIAGSAEACWGKLNGHWRDTPYNEGGADHAAGTSPFKGGVFNSFDGLMSGRNTVTNVGYWLLSRSLSMRSPNHPNIYSEASDAEFEWFGQWLKMPGGIQNTQGLILERPLGNAANPNWHWSGDQGLFIRALGADDKRAGQIADAVFEHMTDSDGILHEYKIDGALTPFIVDYATGKGIFMRSLPLLVASRPSYVGFIKRNAAAVWSTRDKNQFTFNWSPHPGTWEPAELTGKSAGLCNLVLQAAGQDALNTALAVGLAEQPIDSSPTR